MSWHKNLFKEFIVVNGKCSHCGLSEVFMSDNPFYDTYMVKTETGLNLFACLCYPRPWAAARRKAARSKPSRPAVPWAGAIPASHLDTPVDYESLTKLGSIMGSGGMIVMDQTTNMVDVARFFMEFCMDESCGKCVPCRAGTVQMHGLLTKMVEKRATERDLQQLEELCDMVKHTSLCGLGQTAPNPVLSTLRFFRDEYLGLLQPPVHTPNPQG